MILRNMSRANETSGKAGHMRENRQTTTRFKRASQTGYLLYCVLFISVCLTPLLGLLLGVDSPNLEKRTLAQKPSWSVNGKINPAFTSQFDAYFTDQFTFRSWLIGGWHSINQILLQRSGSNRVIAGQDGWLFYQDTLDDYLGDPVLDSLALKRLDRVLLLQQEWLANQGIPFLFVIVPNKNSVYPEMMPDQYRPIRPESNLEHWMNTQSAVNRINLTAILRDEAQANRPTILYHQTDSHWNNLGAAYAADEMLAAMQEMLPDLSTVSVANQEWLPQQDWQGDLAVMLNPSGPLPDWQYYLEMPETFRYVRPIKSPEDIKILTSATNGRYHLLMFRDSFANALIPLLSPRFAQAMYSRALPYDYSLVASAAKATADSPLTDLVLLEIVERNLPLLLETTPRMPSGLIKDNDAAEISEHILSAANIDATADANNAPPVTVAVTSVFDRDWLKLTGVWLDQADSSTFDRVAIGFSAMTDFLEQGAMVMADADLPAVFLEAFPICSAVDREKLDLSEVPANSHAAAIDQAGGFTLYLEPGQWIAGTQDLVVAAHDANGWKTKIVRITLP